MIRLGEKYCAAF